MLLLSDPNNGVSQNATDPDYNVYTIITRITTSGSNTTIQSDSDRVKTVAAQTQDASNVVCFCKGSYIETPSGPCDIADLRVGDLVHTLDRGAVAIQWIGVAEWGKDQVKYSDRLRPGMVPVGALGPHVPECDLYVSPHHRLLIKASDAICGTTQEVFASAKHLVGHNGIRYSVKNDCVAYYHIWLGKHEIINSNGAYTESYFSRCNGI